MELERFAEKLSTAITRENVNVDLFVRISNFNRIVIIYFGNCSAYPHRLISVDFMLFALGQRQLLYKQRCNS